MFYWGDWTFILILPVLFLSLYLQFKVKSVFSKYSRIGNSGNITGAEMARLLLRANGIYDVDVEPVTGVLSDHYDPASKKVRLSQKNYAERSLAAVTVAAHEVGHAIQHHAGYAPLSFRSAIFPLANIGSSMALPLFFIGLLFSSPFFLNIGILVFIGAVLFHIVTLPVEFNASKRALVQLEQGRLLSGEEMRGARKILTAAALTYVAATLMAVMQLVRMLILKSQYDD